MPEAASAIGQARAEPVLSVAKECPRDSGRDARATKDKNGTTVSRYM